MRCGFVELSSCCTCAHVCTRERARARPLPIAAARAWADKLWKFPMRKGKILSIFSGWGFEGYFGKSGAAAYFIMMLGFSVAFRRFPDSAALTKTCAVGIFTVGQIARKFRTHFSGPKVPYPFFRPASSGKSADCLRGGWAWKSVTFLQAGQFRSLCGAVVRHWAWG